MRRIHEFLATVPFDLYGLTIFQLVATEQSFSKAAQVAGLTQSAVSRQVAAMELKLGAKLFERTTRRVQLTEVGHDLAARTRELVSETSEILRAVQEAHHLRAPTLRVGLERSIGLAYLPGFFFAFQKARPDVLLSIQHDSEQKILTAIEEGELDAGLVALPRLLSKKLRTPYRFEDAFALIVPPALAAGTPHLSGVLTIQEARRLTANQRWLLLDEKGRTGASVHAWMKAQAWESPPAMELDSFDTIANLVALGLGVALVPHRVLALYGGRRAVARYGTKPRFSRTIAVVIRKTARPNPLLEEFVSSVLF